MAAPPPVTPYADRDEGKKAQVAQMFDAIAKRYDLLNHSLTLGIDILWRRRAIRELRAVQPRIVLDIATGTADFAIEALKLKPTPQKVIGVDISENMLAVGRTKVQKKGASQTIELISGDSEALPFDDNYAEALTVGFGVRNFENLDLGLQELHRVLTPGGRAVILEPSFPQSFPLGPLFKWYFTKVLPAIGRLVSKDEAAYSYLPASVAAFPSGQAFLGRAKQAGFATARHIPLTFGICALYVLDKAPE